MEERLQKIMARAGFGSRRSCEELIAAGRVRVNGQVAGLGSKADPAHDQITLDGRAVGSAEQMVYVMIYKPRGVITAVSDPHERSALRDLVPVAGSLYPVGRLDMDSEGLVLLTNDGELTNRLTHPRYEHEKEYRVLVAKHPDAEQLQKWRRGVVLEDGFKTAHAEVFPTSGLGKGTWLKVILKEGHKREIREMGKVTGLPVVRIIRVRMGSLRLGNMKPRDWRYLTEEELAGLKGPPARTTPKPKPKPKRKPRTGR